MYLLTQRQCFEKTQDWWFFHFVYGAIRSVPALKIALKHPLLFCPRLKEVVAAEEAEEGMVLCMPESKFDLSLLTLVISPLER